MGNFLNFSLAYPIFLEPNVFLAVCLTFVGWLGVLLIPFGLPGHWLIVGCGFVAGLLDFGWSLFGVLLFVAILAEIIEFRTSLKYAKLGGASRLGLWGAFFGSIVGAVVGTPLFPLIGTLLGAGLGAFAGAALLEIFFSNRSALESVKVGKGAFIGTLLGAIFKISAGVLQAVWLTWVIWFGN